MMVRFLNHGIQNLNLVRNAAATREFCLEHVMFVRIIPVHISKMEKAMSHPSETSLYHTLALSSDPAVSRRYMVFNEPIPGNLRFGLLLEILDKVAEETALKYVNRFYPNARVVTAAIDNILVRHVADVAKDLLFKARINHVGRSSVEVGIRVEQTSETMAPIHIASCYFTMVARDGAGENVTSVTLPPLDYDDEIARERAQKALKRRNQYKSQQALQTEPPSKEEYQLLNSLHVAQEQTDFKGFLASRLTTEGWERMYPEQENVPQKIFGGYLIRRAYEMSSVCSELIASSRSIIIGVNRINFFHPVRMGDVLHFTSRVVYSNESFVCVEANIERISRDKSTKALSNSCLFTFANVDKNLVHLPVSPVYPTTYAEDARYLMAHRSFQLLIKHRRIIGERIPFEKGA